MANNSLRFENECLLLLIRERDDTQEGEEAADEGDDAPQDDRRVQRHEVLPAGREKASDLAPFRIGHRNSRRIQLGVQELKLPNGGGQDEDEREDGGCDEERHG